MSGLVAATIGASSDRGSSTPSVESWVCRSTQEKRSIAPGCVETMEDGSRESMSSKRSRASAR